MKENFCFPLQLNTLLNDPDAEPLEPKSSVFTTSANQVEGSMEYSFQEGDIKQPVSFLNELKMQSGKLKDSIISRSGSAVVTSKLVFNSSSPVPSESLVLNATRTLLSSRLTNLSDSTKVLNISYEKRTDTSYVLLITFSLSNVSMPDSADLRNNTYVQVQNSINKALNALLDDADAEPLDPKSSVFTSGSAVVTSKLVFNSSSPVPSESLVLNATRTLLSSRLTNLSDSTKVLNISYEKKTDTSVVVIFIISLSSISMPDNTDFRNNTYIQVQNSINNVLNTLLTDPGNHPFNPQIANFTYEHIKSDSWRYGLQFFGGLYQQTNQLPEAAVKCIWSATNKNPQHKHNLNSNFTDHDKLSHCPKHHFPWKQHRRISRLGPGHHYPLKYSHHSHTHLDYTLLYAVWLLCRHKEALR
ncbi:hypothetical protein SRHO_G00048290 [Serrasalmus rhombeus]